MPTFEPNLSGRIVRARVERREVALRRRLGGTKGQSRSRLVRLLWLEADDGCRGVGEASSVDWLGNQTGADADSTLDALVARIDGDAPSAGTLLGWSLDAARPSAVRSALQTALLDLEARRRGASFAQMLGAPAPHPSLPLSALVGDDASETMAEEARRLAESGITSFKLKVGGLPLEDDLRRVAAVREAVGANARLRLDANGAWSLDAAVTALRALSRFAPEMVEEPLSDPRQATVLRETLGDCAPAIALDESIANLPSLKSALGIGGFQTLVLKLERVGGPLPALLFAESAARAGVSVVFTDSIESEVGRAATLHTAAAVYQRTGAAPCPVGLGGLFLLDEEPASIARPDARDSRVFPADCEVEGPGLGIANGVGPKP